MFEEEQEKSIMEPEVVIEEEPEHLTMTQRRALQFKKCKAKKSLLDQLAKCGFSRIDGLKIIGDHKKLPPNLEVKFLPKLKKLESVNEIIYNFLITY